MATFPSALHYDPRCLDDVEIDVRVVFARLLLRLEHLQNLFFIERLLLRLGNLDEGDLLVVSFEMLSLTLLFWTHKDTFSSIRRDLEWLVSLFLDY